METITSSYTVFNASSGTANYDQISTADLLVFTGLESLGCMAVIGNLCLIVVLLRYKYLSRASFILMLSLAVADALHGLVTTLYFYPPIVLKRNHFPKLVMRLFNIVDWTAWAITLTHMSAICLDRLTAIMLYGRYSLIVTVTRIRAFSVSCWVVFTTTNTVFFLFDVCCMILPLGDNDYYSFGYHNSDRRFRGSGIFNYANVYVFTYTPIEIATIIVLSVSNPITLVQLYRRRKRRQALRQASAMLIAMSMRMGNKNLNGDVRELAAKKASRQQQRIMMQISVVAVIFFAYMSAYYLSYYVFAINSKWAMAFHSFFYSTTHMINPVIYFTCNGEMRAQLRASIRALWLWSVCRSAERSEEFTYGCSRSTHNGKRSQAKCSMRTEYSEVFKSSDVSNERPAGMPQPLKSSDAQETACDGDSLQIPGERFHSSVPTETSPLYSSKCQYKSIAVRCFANHTEQTASSRSNLLETMNCTRSLSSLNVRKESGLHFDEKSNTVSVDVVDDADSEDASWTMLNEEEDRVDSDTGDDQAQEPQKPPSRLCKPRGSLPQALEQRSRLLDRLIASLNADEDDSVSEDSSSDEETFPSSSSSIVEARPPMQPVSVEFTPSRRAVDSRELRVSATENALTSCTSPEAAGDSDDGSVLSNDENEPLLPLSFDEDTSLSSRHNSHASITGDGSNEGDDRDALSIPRCLSRSHLEQSGEDQTVEEDDSSDCDEQKKTYNRLDQPSDSLGDMSTDGTVDDASFPAKQL